MLTFSGKVAVIGGGGGGMGFELARGTELIVDGGLLAKPKA